MLLVVVNYHVYNMTMIISLILIRSLLQFHTTWQLLFENTIVGQHSAACGLT